MKLFRTTATLFVLNILIFCILYATGTFNAYVFKSVSTVLAELPLTSLLRTLLMMLWLTVPQSLLLYGINGLWFKLPAKKFIIVQTIFAVVAVIMLYLALLLF